MLVAAPSGCSFCMPYAGRLRSADESVRYFAGEGSADIETAVGLRSTGYCGQCNYLHKITEWVIYLSPSTLNHVVSGEAEQ